MRNLIKYFFPIMAMVLVTHCKQLTNSEEVNSQNNPGGSLLEGELVKISKQELFTDEKGREDSFEVFLTQKPNASVRIYIRNSSSTDVQTYLSYLDFTPEDWDKPQTIRVKGINDLISDGDSQLFIILASLQSNDLRFHGYDPPDVKVWNYEAVSGKFQFFTHEDGKEKEVNIESDTISMPEGSSINITLSFNSYPVGNMRMIFTFEDEVISFSQNEIFVGFENWKTRFPITINSKNDIFPGEERIIPIRIDIDTSDPSYNEFYKLLGDDPTLKIKLIKKKVEINAPKNLTITEGESIDMNISLSSGVISDLVIELIDHSEGELIFTPSTITFKGLDLNISRDIKVSSLDNAIYMKTDRNFEISYVIRSEQKNPYSNIKIQNTLITIQEDIPDTVCERPNTNTVIDFPEDGSHGTGTMDDPYIICNADQLQAMKDGLGFHYELGQDIDASLVDTDTCPAGATGTCTGFQPIGTGANSFTGTLDGKGFTISHLRININLTSGSHTGLFGVTSEAEIKNIGLLDVNISSSGRDHSFAGGLVGWNNSSSITNSWAIGNVSFIFSSSSSFGRSSAGGLVGLNNDSSSVINSYSMGNVSSTSSGPAFYASSAGGLVGGNDNNSRISNSWSTGDVSSSASVSSEGGLVGHNYNSSSIINSYSTGNVSSFSSTSFSYAGGLVGNNITSSSIINSYSTGNVSSSADTSHTGSLVGQNKRNSSITNSYYDINTSTLFKNGSEVSDTAVGNNSAILTCSGGLLTSTFISPTELFTPPTTEPCEDDPQTMIGEPLKAFFNWYTPFDIDNADSDDDSTTGTDESTVRYDSNNDGNITNTDAFVWNFGTTSEYPFIASIPQTLDEQAVRMASGFLRFSNTTLGTPSATDFLFFYDIDDTAMDITTSGAGVQGTTAGNYIIENAVDAADTALTGTDLPTVNASGVITLPASFASGSEFYLKVTFTRGALPNTASFIRRYRFKK